MSKNQIAVINQNMFGDIDFGRLGKTISDLAEGSSVLNDKEKEMAISVIGEWEKDVISKLYIKSNEAADIISILDRVENRYTRKSINDIFTDDQLLILAERYGFTAVFNKYVKAKEDIKQLVYPEKPIVELDTTTEQRYLMEAEFSVAAKKYHMQSEAFNRKKEIATKNLIVELSKSKEVQELLEKAKKFYENVNSVRNECKELSQIAKLNVVISSEKVRDTLKEMLKFGSSL